MTGAIQRGLRALGIFLTGAFTGILLFMTWAEHNEHLEVKPSLYLTMMVGISIALMAVFIPGLLCDAAAGVSKLKGSNSQNPPPESLRR